MNIKRLKFFSFISLLSLLFNLSLPFLYLNGDHFTIYALTKKEQQKIEEAEEKAAKAKKQAAQQLRKEKIEAKEAAKAQTSQSEASFCATNEPSLKFNGIEGCQGVYWCQELEGNSGCKQQRCSLEPDNRCLTKKEQEALAAAPTLTCKPDYCVGKSACFQDGYKDLNGYICQKGLWVKEAEQTQNIAPTESSAIPASSEETPPQAKTRPLSNSDHKDQLADIVNCDALTCSSNQTKITIPQGSGYSCQCALIKTPPPTITTPTQVNPPVTENVPETCSTVKLTTCSYGCVPSTTGGRCLEKNETTSAKITAQNHATEYYGILQVALDRATTAGLDVSTPEGYQQALSLLQGDYLANQHKEVFNDTVITDQQRAALIDGRYSSLLNQAAANYQQALGISGSTNNNLDAYSLLISDQQKVELKTQAEKEIEQELSLGSLSLNQSDNLAQSNVWNVAKTSSWQSVESAVSSLSWWRQIIGSDMMRGLNPNYDCYLDYRSTHSFKDPPPGVCDNLPATSANASSQAFWTDMISGTHGSADSIDGQLAAILSPTDLGNQYSGWYQYEEFINNVAKPCDFEPWQTNLTEEQKLCEQAHVVAVKANLNDIQDQRWEQAAITALDLGLGLGGGMVASGLAAQATVKSSKLVKIITSAGLNFTSDVLTASITTPTWADLATADDLEAAKIYQIFAQAAETGSEKTYYQDLADQAQATYNSNYQSELKHGFVVNFFMAAAGNAVGAFLPNSNAIAHQVDDLVDGVHIDPKLTANSVDSVLAAADGHVDPSKVSIITANTPAGQEINQVLDTIQGKPSIFTTVREFLADLLPERTVAPDLSEFPAALQTTTQPPLTFKQGDVLNFGDIKITLESPQGVLSGDTISVDGKAHPVTRNATSIVIDSNSEIIWQGASGQRIILSEYDKIRVQSDLGNTVIDLTQPPPLPTQPKPFLPKDPQAASLAPQMLGPQELKQKLDTLPYFNEGVDLGQQNIYSQTVELINPGLIVSAGKNQGGSLNSGGVNSWFIANTPGGNRDAAYLEKMVFDIRDQRLNVNNPGNYPNAETISVDELGGLYWVTLGRHRVAAAKALNLPIYAQVHHFNFGEIEINSWSAYEGFRLRKEAGLWDGELSAFDFDTNTSLAKVTNVEGPWVFANDIDQAMGMYLELRPDLYELGSSGRPIYKGNAQDFIASPEFADTSALTTIRNTINNISDSISNFFDNLPVIGKNNLDKIEIASISQSLSFNPEDVITGPTEIRIIDPNGIELINTKLNGINYSDYTYFNPENLPLGTIIEHTPLGNLEPYTFKLSVNEDHTVTLLNPLANTKAEKLTPELGGQITSLAIIDNSPNPITAEQLIANGLEAKYKMKINGTTVYTSDIYLGTSNVPHVVGYVEFNGQVYARNFYYSRSGQEWRVASHYVDLGKGKIYIGKGNVNEIQTSLSVIVQEHLDSLIQSGHIVKPKELSSREIYLGLLKETEYIDNAQNRAWNAESIYLGEFTNPDDPTSLVFFNDRLKPNFSELSLLGKKPGLKFGIEIYKTPSMNGRFNYYWQYEPRTKNIALFSIKDALEGLNSFGVNNTIIIDREFLLETAIYEYPGRVPPQYENTKNMVKFNGAGHEYVDVSAFTNKIPINEEARSKILTIKAANKNLIQKLIDELIKLISFHLVSPAYAQEDLVEARVVPIDIYRPMASQILLNKTLSDPDKLQITTQELVKIMTSISRSINGIKQTGSLYQNEDRLIYGVTGLAGKIAGNTPKGTYQLKVKPIPGVQLVVPETIEIAVGETPIINIGVIEGGKGVVSPSDWRLKINGFFSLVKGGILDLFVAQAQTNDSSQTPSPGLTEVQLYLDQDGNGQRDFDEPDVPWAGVSVELTPTTQAYDYQLNQGWNLIAFPFLPTSVKSASDVITDINLDGGSITTIAYWDSDHWVEFSQVNDQPYGQDFALKPNTAYFVDASVPLNWSVAGETLTGPNLLDLHQGWNTLTTTKTLTANDFIEQINTLSCLPTENCQPKETADALTNWTAGTWQVYVSRIYSRENQQTYGDNFSLEPIRGYMIRLKESVSFTQK